MIALRSLSLALVVLFFGAAYSSPIPAPSPTNAPTHPPKPLIVAVGVNIERFGENCR